VFGEVWRLKSYTVLKPRSRHCRGCPPHCGTPSAPIDLLVVATVLTTTNGVEVAKRLSARSYKLSVLYVSEERTGELGAHGELPSNAPFLAKALHSRRLVRETGIASRQQECCRLRQRSPNRGQKAGVDSHSNHSTVTSTALVLFFSVLSRCMNRTPFCAAWAWSTRSTSRMAGFSQEGSLPITTSGHDEDYAAFVIAERPTSAAETLSCGMVRDAA
jgi:hypothetical protein